MVDGGNIADCIRVVAEELDVDLIIMGTRGRSGLMQVLLGSVAEQTLRCAPCPVMAVRADGGEGRADAQSAVDGPSASSPSDLPGLETLSAAIERLGRSGFDQSFLARGGKLYASNGRQLYDPEDLLVREVVRFEGESAPGDSSVLVALRSCDGSIRGIFVAG